MDQEKAFLLYWNNLLERDEKLSKSGYVSMSKNILQGKLEHAFRSGVEYAKTLSHPKQEQK